MRFGGRSRLPAALLALALVAAGCSGIDPDAIGPAPTTTTSIPASTPVAGPSSPVSVTERDVPDTVYPGLGDPRIDVGRYDVKLAVTPGTDAIRGTVHIRGQVRTAVALPSFTLDLHALRVRSARVNGRAAAVAVDGDQIVVTPAQPLRAGTVFRADIAYGGVPAALALSGLPGVAIGWQHDAAGGTFTLSEPYGTRTWMPVSEHPSDKAVFRVSVDVPAGYQVVGNGRLVSRVPVPTTGHTVWTWSDPAPMAAYLALVAVGHYDLVQRTSSQGLYVAEAYPLGTTTGQHATFADLDRLLAFYANRYGPYPFGSTGVLVVPKQLDVALETQTRPTFGRDAFGDGEVLAHELAHQWFGDSVSPATWTDVWLSEGFATYATWEWDEHTGGPTVAETARRLAEGMGPTTRPVLDRTTAEEFDQVIYDRGALTLYALRHEIGKSRFNTVLRLWTRTRAGRSGSTAQFAALASEVSGRDLRAFFRAWLDEAKVPPFPG